MKKHISIYLILFSNFIILKSQLCQSQGIWTYYTDELPGVVFNMTQDNQGNYWLATDNCVCKLDTNGLWTILEDTTVWDATMYFKNEIVVDRDNNKWFVGVARSHGTKEYVVKYDDSTFTYYNPSGKEEETWIRSLGVDSSGYIWAGSMANWAYWFDGSQWHPFLVPGTTLYDPILEFGTDRKGTLYIGHTNGISTLNGYLWGDFRWRGYNFSFDRDNRLWFGTNGWGLGVYDGQHFTRYTTSDGLLSNYTGVAIDSSYRIWVAYGLITKVVSRFNGQYWEHLNLEDELLGDTAVPLYVDKKGAIWFWSIYGLSVYVDTTTTNVKQKFASLALPEIFVLYQNFPNPFNSITMIRYELPQEKNIHLSIFNLNGEEVMTIVSGKQGAGKHQVVWNGVDKSGKEVTSGIYFSVLKNGSFTKTRKMTLIR